MRLNHAILHVFDFVSCVNTFARDEMNLTDKTVKSYITRHIRRAFDCIDNNDGRFSPDSTFSRGLRDYLAGRGSFVGLSAQIGEYIIKELGRMEKPTPVTCSSLTSRKTPTPLCAR